MWATLEYSKCCCWNAAYAMRRIGQALNRQFITIKKLGISLRWTKMCQTGLVLFFFCTKNAGLIFRVSKLPLDRTRHALRN